jgi:sulfide:quinone oxidoreductase
MTSAAPAKVVIAGGGVAALEAALALRALAQERVRVELLAAEPQFWYRPLSVLEPFELGEMTRFDLADLAAAAGASFTLGTLVAIDAASRTAYTSAEQAVRYDHLLVACGTSPKPAVPGALTFRGPADTDAFRRLLDELRRGEAHRVVFAVPAGTSWALPAYELALLTARHVAGQGIGSVELTLVTPEREPLAIFGAAASAAIAEQLHVAGVELRPGVYPSEFRDGELVLVLDGTLPADRVVALPRLEGQRIAGIPQTAHGFVPVDGHGRVAGIPAVFAAGDITAFPLKQGGIATQQADAAAEAIAADAGVDLDPRPFRPVLRGVLLTGDRPRYLQHQPAGGAGEASVVSTEALWWPPTKIVGRHLGPFLAARAGRQLTEPPRDAGVPVEVDLTDPSLLIVAPGVDVLAAERGIDEPAAHVVRDVMRRDALVVAPEDTLGEVAEKMRERDFASALVGDSGRLIGILTARDLLRAFAGRVHPSEARVREWMTAEPFAVTAATTLEAAALLMTEHGVHHLAVVEGARPIGIVGMRDVVRTGLSSPRVSVGLGF